MSASKKEAAEVAQDVAADAVGEVAHQAEQMENFIRSLNKAKLQFGILGAAAGAAAASIVAWQIAWRKADAKYSEISEAEIAEMRKHYEAKKVALDAEASKGDLSELVQERGYVTPEPEQAAPPMAIQPPPAVVEEVEKPVPAPGQSVSAQPAAEPESRNVFEDHAVVDHEWDYHRERAKRNPEEPYVIHYDERHEFEGYQDVTVTYYEKDDVLCDERDDVIDQETRDQLIGELNLERFGHGSNDPSVVYVRNDKLEIVYEVVRSPQSYAEEVHGLKHEEYDRGNIRRMRRSEREYED